MRVAAALLAGVVLVGITATDVLGRAPLRGRASWYDDGGGLYAAAGPDLRNWLGRDWRGRVVRIRYRGHSVTVRLTDWCQCYRGERRERIIDLSPAAFRILAPLSRGTIQVSIGNWIVLPDTLVLPPTDAIRARSRLWSVPS